MTREIEIATSSNKRTLRLHSEDKDKFVIEVGHWIDRNRQQLVLEFNEDNVTNLEEAIHEWDVRRNDHCVYQITPDGSHDGCVSMAETKSKCELLVAMIAEHPKPHTEGYRYEVRPLLGHKELIEKEFGSKAT
jgi:hypothetical protein